MTGCRELYVGIKNGKIRCKDGAWPQVKKHIEFMDEHFPNWLDDDISFANAKLKEGPSRLVRSLKKTDPELLECVLEEICDLNDKPTAKRVKEIIKEKKIDALPKGKPHENVIHDDIRDIEKYVKPGTVDLILTDPPYGGDFLDLWAILGNRAVKLLKPNGLLITYSGHAHFPKVINCLGTYLDYVWTMAVTHKIPASAHPVRMFVKWKPILMYKREGGNPEYEWGDDLIRGHGREKESHDWQQALGEAEEIIKRFSHEGALVVDPFVGSGTVAIAARNTRRNFIVLDNDEEAIKTTNKRLRAEGGQTYLDEE